MHGVFIYKGLSFLFFVVSIYLFSLSCFSQGLLPSSEEGIQGKKETWISGQPMNDLLRSLASSSIYLSKSDIQKSGAKNLKELLRERGNLSIVESSHTGSSSLFLRGTNSNHTLVVWDGVVLNDHTDPGARFEFNDMDLLGVESVEIFKGNLSVLFGSGAIGGVIYIHSSKDPSNKIKLALGSYSLYRGALATGKKIGDKKQLNFMGQWEASHGPSSQGGRSDTLEKDGNRIHSLYSSYAAWNDKSTYRVSYRRDKLYSEYDQGSSMDTYSKGRSQRDFLAIQWRNQKAKSYTETLLSYKISRRDYDYAPSSYYFYKGRDLSGRVLWGKNISPKGFNYGSSFSFQNLQTEIDSGLNKRESLLRYALQASYHFDSPWSSSFGASLDQKKENTYSSWKASLAREEQGLKYALSAATAFKFPSSYNLYDPSIGNPDLSVEKSQALDFLIEKQIQKQRWQINIYEISLQNLIQFGASRYENLSDARVRGIELGYKYFGSIIHTDFSMEYLEAEDLDKKERLLDRPSQHGSLGLEKPGPHSLRAWLEFVGRRDTYGGKSLDSYHLVHLKGSTEFPKNWNLTWKVSNLLNTSYEQRENFTTLGRAFYLEAEKSF